MKAFGPMTLAFVTMALATSAADPTKPGHKPPPKPEGKGECHGVNECKGKGECGGPGYDCAGNNSCKGKGWITLTAAECKKKGGKFKAGDAK